MAEEGLVESFNQEELIEQCGLKEEAGFGLCAQLSTAWLQGKCNATGELVAALGTQRSLEAAIASRKELESAAAQSDWSTAEAAKIESRGLQVIAPARSGEGTREIGLVGEIQRAVNGLRPGQGLLMHFGLLRPAKNDAGMTSGWQSSSTDPPSEEISRLSPVITRSGDHAIAVYRKGSNSLRFFDANFGEYRVKGNLEQFLRSWQGKYEARGDELFYSRGQANNFGKPHGCSVVASQKPALAKVKRGVQRVSRLFNPRR
jgi:hypothetical protein